MDVVWGIILLIVMYFVIPIAIIGGTLALLGGGERFLPPAMRRSRRPADTHADEARPVSSGR
jgi:hypothetical protein